VSSAFRFCSWIDLDFFDCQSLGELSAFILLGAFDYSLILVVSELTNDCCMFLKNKCDV